MKKILAFLIGVALALSAPVFAQTTPTPQGYAVLGGAIAVPAGTTSASVALPASLQAYGALTIYNKGTVDAFVALGDSSVAATTTGTCLMSGHVGPSCAIPAGTSISIYAGSSAYIAAITASGSTNLVLYQGTGPMYLSSSLSAAAAGLTHAVTGTGAAGSPAAGVITTQGITGGIPNNANTDSVVDNALGSGTVSSATTFSFTNAANPRGPFSSVGVTNIDTTGYGSVTFQISANANLNSIVAETSLDGNAWATTTIRNISSVTTSPAQMSATIVGSTYVLNAPSNMIRFVISNYIGGSTTIFVNLKRSAPPNIGDAYVGNTIANAEVPSTSSTNAITPVISADVSNLQGKTSAGNLYDASITNNSGAVAYLYVFNSASNPASGAVTAGTASGNYEECIGVANASSGSIIYYNIPERFSAGLWLAASSAACGTYTPVSSGVVLHGRVQ